MKIMNSTQKVNQVYQFQCYSTVDIWAKYYCRGHSIIQLRVQDIECLLQNIKLMDLEL